MCYENQYEGVVSTNVVKMIRRITEKLGISQDDQSDAEQTVILEVLQFEFDPEKSNGGSEETVLYSLALNTLKSFVRAKARHAQKLENYSVFFPIDPDSGEYIPPQEGTKFLDIDVRIALAQLPPAKQELCHRLMNGEQRKDICEKYGLSKRALSEVIDEIREAFWEVGLADGLEG